METILGFGKYRKINKKRYVRLQTFSKCTNKDLVEQVKKSIKKVDEFLATFKPQPLTEQEAKETQDFIKKIDQKILIMNKVKYSLPQLLAKYGIGKDYYLVVLKEDAENLCSVGTWDVNKYGLISTRKMPRNDALDWFEKEKKYYQKPLTKAEEKLYKQIKSDWHSRHCV
jgi:predicted ribosome-associated RNA-binding protein Tma20